MITREVIVLNHEEEAIYHAQQAMSSTGVMFKRWRLDKISRHGALSKIDAKYIAHSGFLALMHNHVALSLSVEELIDRAHHTEKIRKYSWEK